jgi:hypothetical protein
MKCPFQVAQEMLQNTVLGNGCGKTAGYCKKTFDEQTRQGGPKPALTLC